jgi:acetylornithine/N-succinyldiaminopimelate aminotransferase
MKNILMNTQANKLDVTFERGEGVWLWDNNGKKYLDALSGLGVSALGHAHPAVVQTINRQAGKLMHTSDTYCIAEEVQLAKKLIELSGMEQATFVNSGAEANEVAIKLTRLYAKKNNIQNPIVVAMSKAFHGHTLAATSASDIDGVREGFEPLVSHFVHLPFNDLQTLEQFVGANSNTVAIMLEPIQGDGGIRIADSAYFTGIRRICDTHKLLMIADEVQCGIGRSGKWFAFQYYKNCLPDILTLAKALANGIPIGACLVRAEAYDLFQPKQHGSTFGGNQLASATALTVLETIAEEKLLMQVEERGAQLITGLKNSLATNNYVQDIRGRGLMIGIALNEPCEKIMQVGLEHGVLFNVVRGNILRLLPPLVISKAETEQLVNRLTACINDFFKNR